MPGFVKRYNDLVKDSDCKSLNDYFLETAKLLSTFFQIHPFGDGNGRSARIIYSVMAINKSPFLIPMTHTERYNLDLTDALVRDRQTYCYEHMKKLLMDAYHNELWEVFNQFAPGLFSSYLARNCFHEPLFAADSIRQPP